LPYLSLATQIICIYICFFNVINSSVKDSVVFVQVVVVYRSY